MEESKIKSLEMIQQVISRMANNSFLLKGWTITIIAGMFSLNHNNMLFMFYLLIYFIILIFWLLDSYYLQLERKYRHLYNKVLEENTINFKLELDSSSAENKTLFLQVLMSKTELGFYLLLIIVISIVFIVS